MSRLVVVGGGITGLAAARAAAGSGAEVTILESEDRFGGKVLTERHGDLVVEAGPDSFLAREPWGVKLCEELGLGAELAPPARFGALVWTGSKLGRLPPGFPYGLPTSPWSAWRSGLISARGAARASAEMFALRPLRGPDVSLGAFVRDRFGPEVVANLVDPLLAGTRAGRLEEMSLAAAAPSVDHVARRHRSLILGLRAERRAAGGPAAPPPFVSVRGGMGRLIDHLVAELSDTVQLRSNSPVDSIAASAGGFKVRLGAGETVDSAAVVVCVPSFCAARMLRRLSPEAAGWLDAIEHASVASVTLVYPPGAWTPPDDTSGLLVARAAGRTLAACSWTSSKWPEAAPRDGSVVMRCFVGRAGRHTALDLDDDSLAGRLAADLADILRIEASPCRRVITRWERGLPQYSVGHLDRLEAAEDALAPFGPIVLAGASYRGSGLPDCIRQGEEGARRVVDAVRPNRTR